MQEFEQKWYKMWVLWMNEKMPSPYQEILSYENEVRNGSHLQYFQYFEKEENYKEADFLFVSKSLEGTVLKPIFDTAYKAFIELKNDENTTAEKKLKDCDIVFSKKRNEIEAYLETIAITVDL